MNVGDVLVFSAKESDIKTVYWLVIQESDLDSLIDRQSELFDKCKKINQSSAMDKNISMLILWETGGKIDLAEMKKKVMTVEEDPYFFKKHVLYYSSHELETLKSEMEGVSSYGFLQKNIVSQDVFAKYKVNPLAQGWQSLLYRIAIKMPFVDFCIGSSGGLASLFEINDKKVKLAKDDNLVKFDHGFFSVFNELTSNDIKASDEPAEMYLTKLFPAIEGMSNDD